MKRHPDDLLYYGGVILLGGAAYLVPALCGMGKPTAFLMAMSIMVLYVVGFTWVSNRAGADETNDDEKEDA